MAILTSKGVKAPHQLRGVRKVRISRDRRGSGDVSSIENRVDTLEDDVGDLADLKTTAKTNLVAAINENVANISQITPFARKNELLSKYNGKSSQKIAPYTSNIRYSEDVFSFYGANGVVSSEDDMYVQFTVTKKGISLNAQIAKRGAIPSVGNTLGGVSLAIGKNKIKELLIGLGTTTAEQTELAELYELLDIDSTGNYSAPSNSFLGEPGVECLVMPYAKVSNRRSSGITIAKQIIFSYGYVYVVISAGSFSGSIDAVVDSIVAD